VYWALRAATASVTVQLSRNRFKSKKAALHGT